MLTEYAFWFLTFVAIFSAMGMILSKNPVYSVLSLIVTFFAIAGHYFLLNAQFLAAVHIIVYAGAIMVLFLYVIMMLNLNKVDEEKRSIWSKAAAAASFGIGLAFDPISHEILWAQRTMIQKSIPIIQLAMCAACLGLGFGMNDR